MTQLHLCSKGYFTLAIKKDMDLKGSLDIQGNKSLRISREVLELQVSSLSLSPNA